MRKALVKPSIVQPAMIGTELDTVDPAAGLGMRSDTPNRELMMLRAQFPFVEIMPIPNLVINKILTPVGIPQEIDVPDGAAICRFFATGDFYANFQGQANVPSAANLQDNQSFFRPDLTGNYFYCKGKKQVSVASSTDGRIVTLAFWTFNFTDENRP
jgi:hypothetical protein